MLMATAVLLAGCDAHGDVGKATIAKADADAPVRVRAADDAVKIRVPGLSTDVTLPALKIASTDLDLDGMRMFPGSKVTDVAIDGGGGGSGDGVVRLGFDAPGDPAAVAAWHRDAAARAGYAMATSAPGRVEGTKPDGSRFLLRLVATGRGTHGDLELRDP